MKITPILLFVLLGQLVWAQNYIGKKAVPDWVVLSEQSSERDEEYEGGAYYQLFEIQENIPSSTSFVHYRVKLNNEEGVQDYSDIQVEFDPAYQKVVFHSLRILRKDKEIDLLESSNPKVIQREESLERAIYNGRLTAIFSLEGIQEGDLIDYSYSIVGANPVLSGNYSDVFYQEFAIPVGRLYYRILNSASQSLYFTYPQGGIPPQVREDGALKEYVWDLKGPNVIQFDSNIPSWYDPQARIEVTTFQSWEDVVDWALPLYKYDRNSIKRILSKVIDKGAKKDNVISLIRFVQDEIRYLGFEEGISAYKPHSPEKVFKQKFGDCIDKSLLLSALLTELGVESYPILVNSNYGMNLSEGYKSYQAFDHCVVAYKLENQQYFVDPTISNQGGGVKENYFPNYKFGLPIKEDARDLLIIPDQDYGSLSIEENIKVDSIGGGATFNITTTYTGAKADDVRAYFESNAGADIEKGYLDFYSELYPSISQVQSIEIEDSLRESSNVFIAKEFYYVDNFWSKMDDTMIYETEHYPLVLSSEFNFPSSSKRSMPYSIGSPFIFDQKSIIILPENWDIEPYEKLIENEFIKYQNSIYNTDNIVTIVHEYEVKKEAVPPESYMDFRNSIDNIIDELTYTLTYDRNLLGFTLSRWSLMITILLACIAAFLLSYIYQNFNPSSKLGEGIPKDLGGVMILPILGLIYSFFNILIDFLGPDFFNVNIWGAASNYGTTRSFAFKTLLVTEMFYNIFLLGFILLLLILFVKKRTSFPILITLYFVAIVVVPILDALAVFLILPSVGFDGAFSGTIETSLRAVIGLAIWGTYFMTARRVKETFVKTF